MKFDENTAKTLQQQHNLSETTIKVWRHRGTIPDKYAQENYRTPSAAKEDATAQRIREIMALREIAHTNFRAFEKHPNYADGRSRAADVKKGIALEAQEKKAFLAECAELRNKLSAAIAMPTTSKLRSVLTDKRLHGTIVVGAQLYRKAIQEGGSAMITEKEKKQVVLLLKALKIKLQV
jgi:hypothetical protein